MSKFGKLATKSPRKVLISSPWARHLFLSVIKLGCDDRKLPTLTVDIHGESQPVADGAAQERLPLSAANSLRESNGLAAQEAEILGSDLRLKSYNSPVKRGLVVELLKRKNLLDRFLDEP